MNYREIIGPDELDWKVILLDWKKIGKEELKMGTPMSKDGVEANDASCYGILMDDVQKDKHFQARVIVSGCVDFAKAEEYSGIKISAEAKKAIGKVWSQGGGGLTELPDLPAGVGGGVFWIASANDGNGGHTVDKTFEEIKAAYDSGKDLKVAFTASTGSPTNVLVLNLAQYMAAGTTEAFSFSGVSAAGPAMGHLLMWTITNANSISVIEGALTLAQ